MTFYLGTVCATVSMMRYIVDCGSDLIVLSMAQTCLDSVCFKL
jgi:hypothetical protein